MRKFEQTAADIAVPATLARTRRWPALWWLRHDLNVNRAVYALWAVWFVSFVLLVRTTLGGPDGTRYMSYLRSLVFDRDLLLMNELQHFGQRVIVTSTGYAAQTANIGVIPFWLPFYLIGVVVNWLHGEVGSGLASNYALWLDFGDWVYGLLACLVIYRWARTRFERRHALTATVLVAGGSSFVYYATALAPSYHTISALLSALYLFIWDRTRSRRTRLQWFGISLLLGFLVSMGQYHAVLAVFPLFDLGRASASAVDQTQARKRLPAPGTLLSAGLGFVLPLTPQFVAWWIIFGNPLANPYTLEADWTGAHLADVLLSSYHGLFFTAPILILAVFGWFVGLKREPGLYIGALLAFLGMAYSSSTRIGWWGGVSFGARYFISLTPLLVLGFAELLDTASRIPASRGRAIVALLVGAGTLCAIWTYGLFLQAFAFVTSFSEYYPPQQWLAGQLVVVRRLPEMLAAHWLAPRAPSLLDNLVVLAAGSLVLVRFAGARLLRLRKLNDRRWIAAVACLPVAFALFLLGTAGNGEAHKAELAASGFYEQNLARADFDFEQYSNEYVEKARYDQASGQVAAAHADMQRAIALWTPPARRQAAPAEIGQFQALDVRFGPALQLLGFAVGDLSDDSRVERGPIALDACPTFQTTCSLKVHLLWRASERLPADYDVGVLLLDAAGQVVARTAPNRGLDPFPMSWWLPGEWMRDEQQLSLDGLPAPSLLRMRVEVFDASANKRLPASQDNGVIAELKFSPPSAPSSGKPVAMLGDRAVLLSYQTVREGDGLSVVLVWRAEAAMDADYTVFVHLLDGRENLLAQADGPPVGGRYPTHAWSAGEVIYDVHHVAVGADTFARLDHIAIGMYTLTDGRRLPSSTGADFITIPGRNP